MKTIEEKISQLKKAKDGNDAEAIKRAIQELGEVIQKIGAAMYGQPKEEKSDKSDKTEEGKKDEGPIEGEYEEK